MSSAETGCHLSGWSTKGLARGLLLMSSTTSTRRKLLVTLAWNSRPVPQPIKNKYQIYFLLLSMLTRSAHKKKGQSSMHTIIIISPNAPNPQRVKSSAHELYQDGSFHHTFCISYQETPPYVLQKTSKIQENVFLFSC